MEALLLARGKLVAASRRPVAAQVAISPEEKAALEQLRAELERQEAGVLEAKQALREREAAIDPQAAAVLKASDEALKKLDAGAKPRGGLAGS